MTARKLSDLIPLKEGLKPDKMGHPDGSMALSDLIPLKEGLKLQL